jgi:protein-S-isoprenylcysteine O-methyltransferase Ste14
MSPPLSANSTTIFRLSGALVFAAALAVTGDALVATVENDALWGRLLVNAVLFALFAAHHSAFARSGIKQWMRAHVSAANQRAIYVWIASLLLIGTIVAWQPVGHTLWALPAAWRPWRFLMLALQVAGVLVIAAAARVIDVFELAGLRVAPADRIQIRGPYRVVRHPIYLGFLLVVWCPTTMTGDRLWFAALSTLYLLLAIPFEERSLQGGLGPDYEAYQRRVRWRVIPGIY